MNNNVIHIGPEKVLNLEDFYNLLSDPKYTIELSDKSLTKCKAVIDFIQNYLIKKEIKTYGITTGFADLRDKCVKASDSSQLSSNIIESHDAGIGKPMPDKVVLGAMILRANSLAKGNSGFTIKNLQILVGMINKRIIPIIPETGSLGASGDLCFLARLGRAMKGKEDCDVKYNGKIMSAKEAFEKTKITPAVFGPKEGLALTNGTSFLTAYAVVSYLKEVHSFETIFGLVGMFVNSTNAVDSAFYACIQNVRNHKGQKEVAKIIRKHLEKSKFINRKGVQNDYLIRCMPQIFGFLFEEISKTASVLVNEMNAVTDNPIIFCSKFDEIGEDVAENRIHVYNDHKWVVVSGGNFHGEIIAQVCDSLSRANVKPILTLERHLTYLLNPHRNKTKKLPCYLINNEKNVGLLSGFMITQYTANALAQKIAFKGNPTTVYNITSANESEDVVSYGATSAQKLFEQLEIITQFLTIYVTTLTQAYSIVRKDEKEEELKDLLCEKIFQICLKKQTFPLEDDVSFNKIYGKMKECIYEDEIRKIMEFPLNIKDFPKNTHLKNLN